mmetsp:Transcript_21533/g.46065  ORF Transcript_21533/g.46065 Transcript_21533/m.46065 type:complete len:303 (-) Transcript_21533:453-1361(-)
MRLGPLGFSLLRCSTSASIAFLIPLSFLSISSLASSSSASSPLFRSEIMLISSPCLLSAAWNSDFREANIRAALRRSLASSSITTARFTSAAADRVLSEPASSSAAWACRRQKPVDRRSAASRSSAILALAMASADFFCACAAASAALCVTVEFQSLLVQFSADWMACSATLTALAASARLASSSERSSMIAWWSSSTISWSTPPVSEETWDPASASGWSCGSLRAWTVGPSGSKLWSSSADRLARLFLGPMPRSLDSGGVAPVRGSSMLSPCCPSRDILFLALSDMVSRVCFDMVSAVSPA